MASAGWGEAGAELLPVDDATNELVRPLHDRMPVILRPDEFDLWLDRGAGTADVRQLLDSYPADQMAAVPLTTRINSSRNDDPACLVPLNS